MRLLAYGGIGYFERQRIGVWETTPRDALDDSFRLEEKQLTFGLGLIEKEPILVVRQLQVTKTGRAYAYSVLLDPGADVWERFGWDAAALAEILFDEEGEWSKLLLEQPEKLNAQDLEEVLTGLNPKTEASPEQLKSGLLNDGAATWIGAFFAPSSCSWPSHAFGFATRPNFAETSSLLRPLPRCFRAGLGWLIGGTGQSARSFGAQFSVDDRADGSPDAADLALLGHKLFGALQTLANDDDFADVSKELTRKPIWKWSTEPTENPAALAERLIMIAALLDAAPESDQLEAALAALPQNDFLKIELRRAWQRAAFSRGQPLTPAQTSFALENYFDCQLPMRAVDIPLLDVARLADRFAADGLEPSHPNVPHLPPPARYKVWSASLRQAQERDLPGAFFRAIEDIEAESGDEATGQVSALTHELGELLSNSKSLNLLFWSPYLNRPHSSGVKNVLRDVARARVLSSNPGWQADYLLFADDLGAEWLAVHLTAKDEWRELVRILVQLVRDKHEFAEAAQRWLASLANSSVREKDLLDYEHKVLISQTVRDHKWILYVDLWELYVHKQEVPNPPAASETDRRILLIELAQLIRQKPVENFVPDLRGLQKMLGPLPANVMEYFQGLSPSFSKAGEVSQWVSFWAETDPRRASKETVRVLLEVEGDVSFADYWLRPEFEEMEMRSLLFALMFRGHPTRGRRYQKRFRELLTKAQVNGVRRFLNAVRLVFRDGIDIKAQAYVFCERFARDREVLGLLLSCLPKTTSGLALTEALFKFDEFRFVAEAHDAWFAVQERKTVLTPYQGALMYHLKKKRDARIQVERLLQDQFPGEAINLGLEEILKRGVEAGTFAEQFDEPEEVVENGKRSTQKQSLDNDQSEGHSVGDRLKNWLGVGVARKARSEPEGAGGRSSGKIFQDLDPARRTSREKDSGTEDS